MASPDKLKDSKLIYVIQKLDEQSIERLKYFMRSPYHVVQKSVSDFAELVLSWYPDFQQNALNEKKVYRKLYPRQKFQGSTINDLMTLMIASIYKFMAVENFQRDHIDEQLRLMEELKEKEIGKEFVRISLRLSEGLEKQKKDKEYYYNLMRYETELDDYNIGNKEFLNNSDRLQKKANALDVFFLSTKLSLICDMVNRQNIYSSEYDISMMDVILDYVEQNIERFENYSAVSIYYRILLTLTKPEAEENYFKLIDLLDKAYKDFSMEELKDMYTYAKNYCVKQINKGKLDYVSNLFKLYRKLIDTGLIYENNHLSQWDYKNIISTSLRLSEFEWTEQFIHSQKHKINILFRDLAYNYNLANLYYEKRDFPKALKNLNLFNDALKNVSDPDFDDTFYNLDSRSMFLKIYYALEEHEPFRATIETFKSYLVRNRKISESQRNSYINLLKYTKKLNAQRQRILLSPAKSIRFNVKKLKSEINAEKNTINLPWLQARVEELETKIK